MEKQEKVADLRQQLRNAEVDAALVEAAVTMHTVTPVTESAAPLGPVLTTEVKVEGSRVKALVDSGSPVTIVLSSSLLIP